MEVNVKTDSIVASVWREGNNCGCVFTRNGKSVLWDDMNADERREVASNLLSMGDLFAKFARWKEKEVK